MNPAKIALVLDEYDLDSDDVEEIAESVGMVYAETGSKRQFKQYEPDDVHIGMASDVPEGQTQEATKAVLTELCWDAVEEELSRRKEQYVRKDDD